MARVVIHRQQLREKGITYHRNHIAKLVREGKFPPPLKGMGKTDAWFEDEIDRVHRRPRRRTSDHLNEPSPRLWREPGKLLDQQLAVLI